MTIFSFPSFTWERHADEALLHQCQAKLGIQCVPKQSLGTREMDSDLRRNDGFSMNLTMSA